MISLKVLILPWASLLFWSLPWQVEEIESTSMREGFRVRAQGPVVMTTGQGVTGGPQSGIAKRIDVFWTISHCLDSPVFISCNRRFRKRLFVSKSVKLAADEDHRRLLIPLLPEPEDSGIDSDRDAPEPVYVEEPRVPNLRFLELSEASASDEESDEKPWWRRPLKKNNQQNNAMENQPQSLNLIRWQSKCPPRQRSDDETEADRASPSLYEVELTASDEDDDGSVLELVIPMQSARYQRTSAPPSKKIITNCLICKFLCCVRK